MYIYIIHIYIYAARAAAQLLLIPSFFLRFYDTKVTISILLSIPTHMPISERGKAALPNNGRDLHVLSIPLRKSLWVAEPCKLVFGRWVSCTGRQFS